VNKQISRIALVGLLLLAALIVATTYWQTWAPASLRAKQDNANRTAARVAKKRRNMKESLSMVKS